MKTRNGFVSNSSSSSFLIAFKPGQQKVRINIEIDLDRYMDIFSNISELVKSEDFECIEDYVSLEDIKEYFDNGYKIGYGRVSDEDEPLEAVLCHEGIQSTDFKGKIFIGEGGY